MLMGRALRSTLPCASVFLKQSIPQHIHSRMQDLQSHQTLYHDRNAKSVPALTSGQASNLSTSSEETQVNTLIYCMGDEADDVLRGLKLTEAEQWQFNTVRDGFHDFFIAKESVVYERARFNMRKQEPNDTVDAFATALYTLVL